MLITKEGNVSGAMELCNDPLDVEVTMTMPLRYVKALVALLGPTKAADLAEYVRALGFAPEADYLSEVADSDWDYGIYSVGVDLLEAAHIDHFLPSQAKQEGS